jgi:hypothetical protein
MVTTKEPLWQGITLEDIHKQWKISKDVGKSFYIQLEHFAAGISRTVKNHNITCYSITLDDIHGLWEQSGVVDGRGSNGQKLAYFAYLIEKLHWKSKYTN